jgi:hypothetical protein
VAERVAPSRELGGKLKPHISRSFQVRADLFLRSETLGTGAVPLGSTLEEDELGDVLPSLRTSICVDGARRRAAMNAVAH